MTYGKNTKKRSSAAKNRYTGYLRCVYSCHDPLPGPQPPWTCHLQCRVASISWHNVLNEQFTDQLKGSPPSVGFCKTLQYVPNVVLQHVVPWDIIREDVSKQHTSTCRLAYSRIDQGIHNIPPISISRQSHAQWWTCSRSHRWTCEQYISVVCTKEAQKAAYILFE